MGFATLPNQVHRKSVKKGFDFTLMVAGETAHWWRCLGHMVGAWRGPALLTSLRCSLRVWILPSLCSGPCFRPCFAPQPVLQSHCSPRGNGPLLTTHSLLEQAPSVASLPTEWLVWVVKTGSARDRGKERGGRMEELGNHI